MHPQSHTEPALAPTRAFQAFCPISINAIKCKNETRGIYHACMGACVAQGGRSVSNISYEKKRKGKKGGREERKKERKREIHHILFPPVHCSARAFHALLQAQPGCWNAHGTSLVYSACTFFSPGLKGRVCANDQHCQTPFVSCSSIIQPSRGLLLQTRNFFLKKKSPRFFHASKIYIISAQIGNPFC